MYNYRGFVTERLRGAADCAALLLFVVELRPMLDELNEVLAA